MKTHMRYKFVHLLLHDSVKFMKVLVNMINNNAEFIEADHVFVTNIKNVYNQVANYPNVIFDNSNSYRLINYYASISEWVICHGMCSIAEACLIKRRNCKKIIWRTWGGMILYKFKRYDFIKNALKGLLNSIWISKVKSFYGIGVANLIDEINMVQYFGSVQCFELGYCDSEVSFPKPTQIKHDDYHVLIGHSGFSNDNHLKIIDYIKKFKDDKVLFCFVLSYGDHNYINTVKKYAEECIKGKVYFLEEFLNYGQYVNFINGIDAIVLDGLESYAIGNISIGLRLQKKFFLNEKGVIRLAFDREGLPYESVERINEMDFQSFTKVINYGDSVCNTSLVRDKPFTVCVTKWCEFLAELERNR